MDIHFIHFYLNILPIRIQDNMNSKSHISVSKYHSPKQSHFSLVDYGKEFLNWDLQFHLLMVLSGNIMININFISKLLIPYFFQTVVSLCF